MKVKVQCPCGARFEFEVQPVNDRMPVSLNCPVCNIDATELANEVIRRQLAATAAPPPSPEPRSGLRIAKSSSAPAPAPATAAPPPAPIAPINDNAPADSTNIVQMCPKHKSEASVESCVVCGKPICLKCMQQFGYVCSVFCRQQAELKRIYVPAYSGQKSVMAGKARVRLKILSLAIAAVVIACLSLMSWYTWFRHASIVYSLTLGNKDDNLEQRMARPPQFFKLVAPNQLLSLKDKQATLLDVTKKQPLWSTPLRDDSKASAAEEDYIFSTPLHVAITTNDIWLAFHSGLVRLDRQTGARKDVPAVAGQIFSVTEAGDSFIAVLIGPKNPPTLLRLNLLDGNAQTAVLNSIADAKSAISLPPGKKSGKTNHLARATERKGDEKMDQVAILTASASQSAQAGVVGDDDVPVAEPSQNFDESPVFGIETPPFTPSGSSVVQLQATLLEQKTVAHQAMKAPKGKSVLDGNVTASQGLDLAQEMMNDSQRQQTGGVEIEDVSRYQVTLHRWFAGEVPDWTGEVTGPPRFYALKTVDLLVSGLTVTALDRNNKKLWEGKLSYPMNYVGEHPPVLETKDSLYVADPGVLTCFDLATGGARWRLNSVGISSVQTDEAGKIYLTTTTAGPEKIKYSQEHNIHERIHPVIMKVDSATGKVLWRLESVGDECLLSGKFLYSTWVSQTQSALKLEEGPDTHFNLNLLSPGSGNVIWNFHVDNQHVLDTEVQQNWILLHFADKVYVLKFFSL